MPFKVDDYVVEAKSDLIPSPSDLIHLVVNVRESSDGSESYDLVKVWPATGRPMLDQGCLETLNGRTLFRLATDAELDAWRRLD